LLIDRIYLRNYRVFEDELELLVPPGLVGVYGPNGAGKSTLLESVLWTLWGKARTSKEEVRSSGSHAECVAELTFEHEGHLYLVRRTISGVGSTVRAEVHCDGLAMAEGVRDAGRYVHSVLGMDDAAFRASVFAEQKQLDAFSTQGPADRRKLVLSLLGVTPLDVARDKARADARETSTQHARLRGLLPDLDKTRLDQADAEARAAAAEVTAGEEERAAEAARKTAQVAKDGFDRLDVVRQEHDVLIVEGRAARAELDSANSQIAELTEELDQLAGSEEKLAPLEAVAAQVPALERQLALLQAVAQAAGQLASTPSLAPPPPVDEAALGRAEQAVLAARAGLGSAEALRRAAGDDLQRAEAALAKSSALSADEDCPLCGQALGDAFTQVQAHRAEEVAAAQTRFNDAEETLVQAKAIASKASAHLQRLTQEVAEANKAREAWQKVTERRAAAEERLRDAVTAVNNSSQVQLPLGPAPRPEELIETLTESTQAVDEARGAAAEAHRLRGRLERRPQAQLYLAQAQERASAAASVVDTLRAKVKSLGYDPGALASAQKLWQEAEAQAAQADKVARAARLAAATATAQAQSAAALAAAAQDQHAQLADLESAAVHLSRTSELLNGFRNSVVASVGPRLAVQAAELFGELTDNEYDRLEVDPETYGLRICDGGTSYDLARFSGSEVDLANLALRVAISEHVRFQAGGTVGLLVLDEVFGPLDEERRARMLLALERLRGRFRQILVVTHSTEIKEQMPNAIEVVKKRGRRATAHVVEV
jgi:exonuclease SbcC